MSLFYAQEHELHLIEARLCRSDPHLCELSGIFSRLYTGDDMPAWEQVPPCREGAHRGSRIVIVHMAVAAVFRALLKVALFLFG
jgi:hypothetical protein